MSSIVSALPFTSTPSVGTTLPVVQESSCDEWEESDEEDCTSSSSSSISQNSKSRSKLSTSDSGYGSDSDSEEPVDEEQVDNLMASLLGGDDDAPHGAPHGDAERSRNPKRKRIPTSTVDATITRSKLPQRIAFRNFNLAATGAVIWRDEPAQGNDTELEVRAGDVNDDTWYVFSIWFGGQKTSNSLISAPELKKGKQANEHTERAMSHPLAKNQIWVSGKTIRQNNYKITFHKKKWPLGRHYASNTMTRSVPFFMMTLAPYTQETIQTDKAIRTDTFIISSKRQPSQLQHARGGSTSVRPTGNIRRNKHIARLETENRAHAAQVVKVNADNRRLLIRDEQHTKGFEHLLKMAQHLRSNLSPTDKLTQEVLTFVSSHLSKTARSKKAMC